MPRRPTIDKVDQVDIVREIEQSLRDDLQDREAWLGKRLRSFRDWINPNPGIKTYPWEGASNITPPVIARAVRTVHARLLGSVFSSDPWLHVLPVQDAHIQSARIREKFLNEQTKNEIPDFYRTVNTCLLDSLVQGTAFAMPNFFRSRHTEPEWRLVQKFEAMGSTDFERTDQEILDELIPEIKVARPLGDHEYEVVHMSQGFERKSRVTIDRDEPEVREDLVSVTIERERVRELIKVPGLSVTDLVFPGNATSLQEDECHHVLRFYWRYPDQVVRDRKQGRFHNLDPEDDGKLDHPSFQLEQVTDLRKEIDAYQGIDSVQGLSGLDQAKVLHIEAYYPWDVNGDQLDEQMIFTYIPILRKLSRWDYRSVIYNQRPFAPCVFMPISERLQGIGLAELLCDLQDEMSTIFNQMNDRENLINNPSLLVEQNAGVPPSVFRNLPPGSQIPVRNVDRVKPLEWQKDAHSGIATLQLLSAYTEWLSTGEISSGVQATRPNAPRTARGTLALISESNILIDTHILNNQYIFFQDLIQQIDSLNQKYLPEEKVFFVVGEADPLTITRKDMEQEVKFYFSGNTASTNLQVRQTLAQLMYTSLSTNPLFTGAFVQMPEQAIRSLHQLSDHYIRENNPQRDSRFLLPQVEIFLQAAEAAQQAQVQGMEEGRRNAMQAQEEESMLSVLQGGTQGGGGGGAAPQAA